MSGADKDQHFAHPESKIKIQTGINSTSNVLKRTVSLLDKQAPEPSVEG
jgi:hypothetical protein